MPNLAGKKVLVAEDDFLIAIEYQILLDRFACETLGPVPSVAEALVLLRHHRPDLALLDVRLADGRATPLAEALKAAGVPFVVVSSLEPEDVPDPALSRAPWLSKPCNATRLRQTMEGCRA